MRKKLIIALASMAVLALIVVTLMNNKAKSAAKIREDIITASPVTVAAVEKTGMTESVSLVGTTAPARDVMVLSEVSGRILSAPVRQGSSVGAGATLFTVDDEVRGTNLQTAQANYDKAAKDLQRFEALLKEGATTAMTVDGYRLAFKNAESQLAIAKRSVADTRITAPIGGIVTTRLLDAGAVVNPGTPVANIVDISTLKVKVNVSERDAFRLRVGDKVTVTTDVYPGFKFIGRVESIAAKGDEAHTYPTEIMISNNQQNPLKAGMFMRVSFEDQAAAPSLVIPREALVGSVREPQVYVVNGKKAELRNIIVGAEVGGKLQVLQGLNEGEKVVVNGQNNLQNGVEVSVVQ
jgi:RND family efflux transporter MFP subunit